MALATRCERDEYGREVGVITHNGHEFRALGASVQGEHVTGYLAKNEDLKTWCGRTMLSCRALRFGRNGRQSALEWHGDSWGDTFGIAFPLTHGRAIVGYALGVGCLFRGELVQLEDWKNEDDFLAELRRETERVCEHWLQVDADDEAEFREQQEREEREEREREEQELEDAAELELSRM